ncbi:adenylate cyclase, partial [Kickxella alabastrina]
MADTSIPESVQRFIEYLQIKTVQPTPDYASCTAYLQRQALDAGFEFRAIEFVPGKPVVILTLPGTSPSLPSIILNSHTDVVPVFEASWTHPPFGAHRVASADGGHRIYARGAQDMKIVGQAYLEAMRQLKGAVRRTVHAVFVPDEEIGGHDGMAKFVESAEFRQLNAGFALDEGMANPHEALRVFYGERAPCWIRFVARGNTGHGSQLIEDTAVEKLLPVIEHMMAFRSEQLQVFRRPRADGSPCTLGDVTSTNLTLLQSGVQHNIVPESAS